MSLTVYEKAERLLQVFGVYLVARFRRICVMCIPTAGHDPIHWHNLHGEFSAYLSLVILWCLLILSILVRLRSCYVGNIIWFRSCCGGILIWFSGAGCFILNKSRVVLLRVLVVLVVLIS